MKLKEVVIYKYKCIEETQKIHIDDNITVLVGMNESGKTSVLEAIAKTNYFQEDEKFDFNTTHDYPRKEKKVMEKTGKVPEAIKCKYYISDDLIATIEKDIGNNLIEDRVVNIITKYNNKRTWEVNIVDKKKFISAKTNEIGIHSKALCEKLNSVKNIEDYKNIIAEYKDEKILEGLRDLEPYFKNENGWESNPVDEYIVREHIKDKLPKFLYYDEYYSLPSRISIEKLNSQALEQEDLKTAKALFELSQIDIDELLQSEDYEDYKAELEATEAIISEELFKYWTTNQNLDIVFDIDKKEGTTGNNTRIVEHILDIRVRNRRARMSLPLRNRSKGFNWFFSFLVWFKKIQEDIHSNYILLLDEPGLNLHASAQSDLLRFIKDLSKDYQIIYTTHSPFMVEPENLNRVRTVLETNNGSVISDSIQEKDPNTLFPLQAALGYDIAQNLFISKNNLLVEGVSDLIYLQALSGILEEKGRIGLSEDITIVPIGGLDKVSVFISLLRGSKLNIVCLLDSSIDTKNKQKLDNLISEKLIKRSKVLFYDDFLENVKEADIEDLFDKKEYLSFFNKTFKEQYDEINLSDLNSDISRIILQISQYLEIKRFNHYRPAKSLLQNPSFLSNLEESTLDIFEDLFKKVNSLF